ncbi:MAG TPA: hypothetical protein VNH11_34515 [Pirellulales bacterium]|nr:hypothetical protein [Pirellulales bacterium]
MSALVLLLLAATEAGATGGLDLDAVAAAVKDREQALENFSVTATIDHIFSLPSDRGAAKHTQWHIALIMDSRGRYRIDGTSKTINEGAAAQPPALKQTEVFDGERRRQAMGEGRLTNGRIGEASTPFILPFTPSDLVWTFNGERDSAYLIEGGSLAAEAEFDGRSVLAFEGKVSEGVDGRFRKVQFLVDSNRGFAVVRKAMLVQEALDADWRANGVVELTSMHEVAEGLWVPRKALFEQYRLPKNGPATILSRSRVELDGWLVNAALDDTTFKWSFPPGVAVDDEISGRTYMSSQVDDDTIKQQLGGVSRLRAGNLSVWAWVAGAVVIAMVSIVGIMRRRTKPRG